MQSNARVTLLLFAALLAMIAVGAAQSDPFVGTWTLDTAKSKYTPGPAPKSQTTTYQSAGKGYKVSVQSQPVSGPAQEWSYTSNLDGTDVKITGNNPNADTIAVKRVNANTLESVNKRGGQITTRQTNVVSADGNTRTVTTTGVDGKGQKVNNVAVFVKQK